jgi:hypothetical protein
MEGDKYMRHMWGELVLNNGEVMECESMALMSVYAARDKNIQVNYIM